MVILGDFEWQRMGFTSYQLLNEGASIIASADRLLGRHWESAATLRAGKRYLDDSPFGRLAAPKSRATGNERSQTAGERQFCRTEICHSSTASADEHELMTTGWLQG